MSLSRPALTIARRPSDAPRNWFCPATPFVVRGDDASFARLAQVTPSWLREQHGDREVVLSPSYQEQRAGQWETTTLRHYVRYVQQPGDRGQRYLAEDYSLVRGLGLERDLIAYVILWVPCAAVLFRRIVLWLGSVGSRIGLHADFDGFNLLCQVFGCKRVRFVFFENAVAVSCSDRYDEGACTSSLEVWGHDSELITIVAELDPGDVLYVPRWWWHAAENLTPSLALSYRTDSLWSGLLNTPVLLTKLLHERG